MKYGFNKRIKMLHVKLSAYRRRQIIKTWVFKMAGVKRMLSVSLEP
jgi:hypothetical protein